MNFHYTEIMTVLLLYLVFSFLTYEVNYSKNKKKKRKKKKKKIIFEIGFQTVLCGTCF